MVVGHHRKLVGGNIIPAPDDKISEIPSGNVPLWPKMQIRKRNLLAIGDAKAPVYAGRLLKAARISSAAALPRIHRLIIYIIGRACSLRQYPSRTGAGIHQSAIAKQFPRCQINFPAFALQVGHIRATAVRPFIPRDPQPAQVFIHRGNKFCAASVRIKIFVAKKQRASGFPRPLRCRQKSAGMAQMQKACRRRRNPAAVGRGHPRIVVAEESG